MEAIILAGGLGTRLKSVITDIPKPMAPVAEKPFLSYILDDLSRQGVKRVVLSTGYKHEVVEDYFGDQFNKMEIVYSVEDIPLGTGGAIRKALQRVMSNEALIMNGDTMFRIDLPAMRKFHRTNKADMTMALKKVDDCARYGRVESNNHRVSSFSEPMEGISGNINGGIYYMNEKIFNFLDGFPDKFSFEKDFLEVYASEFAILAFPSDAYFIDIGIPEDYEKAKKELIFKSV